MRHEWDLRPGEPIDAVRGRVAAEMSTFLEGADAKTILEHVYGIYGRKMALVSSFGAESVVLLHLVSEIDRNIPVIFIDTHMLFAETLAYQLELSETLELNDLRRITPDDVVLRLADAKDDLHQSDQDSCCHLRKAIPLETELLGFDAWITGRKRHQTRQRANMTLIEVDHAGRIKANPLANWKPEDVADYMDAHDLPRHPLVSKGFHSIGCAPCTSAVEAGEDPRAGRWRDAEKTECGIHFGPDGVVRKPSKAA